MEEFEKIENTFYASKYVARRKESKYGNPNEIWKSIRDNKELLNWAIGVTKDKFGQKDLVNGLAICQSLLADNMMFDSDIYQSLINEIYSNKDIARIVLGGIDGYSNGGCSYLLMSLWNPRLILSDEQKAFAVDEAMNKVGTTRYQKIREDYSEALDKAGISDENTIFMDIDGSVNPVGEKTKNIYINDLLHLTSDTQAHGTGAFDIRYWILRNSNWSVEEKQGLIKDFWSDSRDYDETLEEWEFDVLNSACSWSDAVVDYFDMSSMYDVSYEDLLKIFDDKEITDCIWEDIQFCKLMHQLRPQQWELDDQEQKKLVKE